MESKYVIGLKDIQAIRFECGDCHASVSVPLRKGMSEYAQETTTKGCCSVCHRVWEITPNSAEHKAFLQFVAGVEGIVAAMDKKYLHLKLEVNKPS